MFLSGFGGYFHTRIPIEKLGFFYEESLPKGFGEQKWDQMNSCVSGGTTYKHESNIIEFLAWF